ncbi:MAG: N-acetylmuramoyl-L-alanine amidase [Lachnospiraceae bacterium]|nr:N-acetylmuramoyl-L-alanine amidase [Lachnospiraceae bacterium]
MNKRDEKHLFRAVAVFCLAFVIITVFITTDINGTIFGKSNKKNKTNLMADVLDKDTVIVGDNFEVITKERIIIKLPSGVNENNTKIDKDLINKKIGVIFPKGTSEYDFNDIKVDNTNISNVHYSIDGNMINIEFECICILDCIPCFDNGELFLDFFKPCDAEMPVVVIDPGHGGYDVGAIEKGIYEKNIDLEICLMLKQLLDSENMLVYYTRLDDSYPTVEERVDFSNEIMPDLFISIHSNAYEDSSVYGTSVLYNTKDKSEKNSLWLSKIMCEKLSESCNSYDKGVIAGNDIHIVRNSKVPVALLEVGFMSNPKDFEMLTSAPGQIKIARGIYNGIIRALTELGKY